MNTPLESTLTQVQNDLTRSKAGLLREAQALRDQMERLVSRLEAGGAANAMDTLGSRGAQFESALSETATLQSVLFHLCEARIEEGDAEMAARNVQASRPLTKAEARDRFRSEMEADGFDVEDYQGRNFYHGPAVRVVDWGGVERVESLTSVEVQNDQMGLGYIVYPR